MPKIPKPFKNETMLEFRKRLVKNHNNNLLVKLNIKKEIKQL
jgi:hypothetical protein